jgi:AraC-like DNA-binding protein
MEYFTAGKKFYPEFLFPLVCLGTLAVPDPSTPYYGLVFIEEGMLYVEETEEKKTLQGPLVLFLKPGHSIRKIDSTSKGKRSLLFQPKAINTTIRSRDLIDIQTMPEFFFFLPFNELPPSGYTCKTFPPEFMLKAKELCERIDDNLTVAQSESWPCLTRSFFLELLILLERGAYLSILSPEIKTSPKQEMQGRVLDFIHTRYNESISLDEIAAQFATNRTSLNLIIRKSCGMSIMAYLNAVRIEVATTLLRNTALTISEVASRTGFADESYFSRSFKKKIGVPPAVYRKSVPDPYSTLN